MNRNKPIGIWRWLLLLTPAIEMIATTLVPYRWAAFLFRNDGLADLSLWLSNLPVALALSLALGLWCASDHVGIERTRVGLCYGTLIAVVNGIIAFAGCSIGNRF